MAEYADRHVLRAAHAAPPGFLPLALATVGIRPLPEIAAHLPGETFKLY